MLHADTLTRLYASWARTPVVARPPVGAWPDNEPAGLSAVFSGQPSARPAGTLIDGSDVFFDYTSQGGSDIGSLFSFGAKWDGTVIEKTTSSGSRYPNVIRKNMFIGDTDGWNGVASVSNNFADDYEALYQRLIFRYSDNWQINGGGEKFWMFGEADGSSSSFYAGPTGSGKVQLRNQGQSGPGGIWRSNSLVASVGEWHTLELSMVAQSALGVADGSFQMWWDDVEITDWQLLSGAPEPDAVEWYNSDYTSRLFSGIQIMLYWGGQGPAKTVNDYLDISEFYITGVPAVS